MKSYLISLWLIFLGAFLNAQVAHYWTDQFGTKTALLGCAFVGGIKDNSAVFYSSAALSFIYTVSVAVNTNFCKLESVTLENAADGACLNESCKIYGP